MNASLIEGMIASLVRFVPDWVWRDVKTQFDELLMVHRSIDERLAAIQQSLDAKDARIATLESIVRACVPEAGPLFGERDMYMSNGIDSVAGIPLTQIEQAPPSKF